MPFRTGNRNRSRHERGYGAAWVKLRKAVLNRDKRLCVPCSDRGVYTVATAVDHIIPKSEGGTDDMNNLQSICKDCHSEKTAQEARRGRG